MVSIVDFLISGGLLSLILLVTIFSGIWLFKNVPDILKNGFSELSLGIDNVTDSLREIDNTLSSDKGVVISTNKPAETKSLSELYYEDTGKNGVRLMYGSQTSDDWAAEVVLRQLDLYYDSFEEIFRVKDGPNRIVRFRATKGGDVAYFEIKMYATYAERFKDNQKFDFKAITVSMNNHFDEVENGREDFVYIVGTLAMVYTGEALIKEDVLRDAMEKSVLESVDPPKIDLEQMVTEYSIVETYNGDYELRRKTRKSYVHPIDYPDLQFKLDEIIYNGKKLDVSTIKMESLLAAIEIGFQEVYGQNILIFGKVGSFKTNLQNYLAQQAGKNPRNKVIHVPADFIPKMSTIKFQEFLDRYASNYGDGPPNQKMIFVIDEANEGLQKDSKAVRSFLAKLDGGDRYKYNISFFLVSNIPAEGLTPDVTRDGRFDLMLTLGLLPADQAHELADKIETKLDEDSKFDRDIFEQILAEDSYIKGQEEVYSPKGFISGAQIYNSCIDKTKQVNLLFNKAIMELEQPKKEKKKNTEGPKPRTAQPKKTTLLDKLKSRTRR